MWEHLQEVQVAEELHAVGPAMSMLQVEGQPSDGGQVLAQELGRVGRKDDARLLVPPAARRQHQVVGQVVVHFGRSQGIRKQALLQQLDHRCVTKPNGTRVQLQRVLQQRLHHGFQA
jgi:hypothetical protein